MNRWEAESLSPVNLKRGQSHFQGSGGSPRNHISTNDQWLTKTTLRAVWQFILEATKVPWTMFEQLQTSLSSVTVSVYDSTIRKWLGKNSIRRVPSCKPLPTRKITTAHPTSAENILTNPRSVEKILCLLLKVEVFWPTTPTIKTPQYVLTSTPGVKHGGGRVKLVYCFRTRTTSCNWWNLSVLLSIWKACLAISLWPQALPHLGSTAGHWSETHR